MSISRSYLPVSLLLLATLLAGCAGGAATGGSSVVVAPTAQSPASGGSSVVAQPTPKASAAPAVGGSVTVNGAGASFPFPLYSRWFFEYAKVDANAKFNYQSIGSGGGIKQATEKTVDFGASDAILTQQQLDAAPGLRMLPVVAGAVVVVYNLADLKDKPALVLDGPTVAGVFLGTVKKWNDPAIAKTNPGVTLPAKDIIVVHRSDGSGTSFIFTSYLSAINADWKAKVGANTSVEWPVGLGGKGNEGVAGTVSQNDGAVGYVEVAYAKQNKQPYAKLVNQAGSTVEATIAATQAAMADSGAEMPATLAQTIVNAPGKDSWPIAGYTYLLVYQDQQDCAKGQKLIQFLRWAFKDGSSYASELEYAPLPAPVLAKVSAELDKITCKGQPLPK